MSPGLRSTIVGIALTVGASSHVASGQTQPASVPQGPVLRASVDQVVVDVVVTDADGAPVTGLTAADFDVFERGKPQTIGSFTEVSLPFVSRAEGAAAPAAGEAPPEGNAGERRLYALVLDDQNVLLELTAEVRKTAHTFVRRYVQAGDQVGVVTTSGLGRGVSDLTADLSQVEAAIDRFAGMAAPSLAPTGPNAGADRNRDRMAHAGIGSDTGAEETARAMSALRTLGSVARSLGTVSGRKAVLYFSQGFAADPGDWDTDERAALLRDVTDAAARANVTIYTFDPTGLKHHEDLMSSKSPQALQRSLTGASRRARHRTLGGLAETTGGQASIDTNNPLPALERVAVDSSRYYLLGYVPTDGKRDGKFRGIEVKARRPNLQVRARQGYYAPTDKR